MKKEYNSCRKSTNEGKKEVVADMMKVNHLKREIKSIEKEIGVETDEDLSKYKDNCEKVKAIIDKYESLTGLRDKYNMYRSSKKRKHRDASNDMKSYERNMKKIRDYEKEKKVKESEKFELSSEYQLMEENTSINGESKQGNSSNGIGSRIVHISMPEVFEEKEEEEIVCFNCHRMQHKYLTEHFHSGGLN